MRNLTLQIVIYASAVIFLIVVWFGIVFLAGTMKANEELKIENFELVQQLRECEGK